MKEVRFETLKGKRIISITGCEKGSRQIDISCHDGTSYRLYHKQDCCEVVEVEDVNGDPENLIYEEVLEAMESTSDVDIAEGRYNTQTWTFYKLATVKGWVDIRWVGESNGYYSESVDFCEVNGEGK